LDEAWREGVPNSWSAQRVAAAVLDAHQSPMSSDDVMAFVSARSRWSPLRPESAQFWRSGAIVVREDGVWELDRTHEVVRSAREAVGNRVSDIRRWAATRPDTVAMEAHRQRIEREAPPTLASWPRCGACSSMLFLRRDLELSHLSMSGHAR